MRLLVSRESRRGLLLGSILGAGMLAITGASGAQAMSLEDAVNLVITTNPDVGVTVKDRRAIDQELRQARGLYFPQIDVQLNGGPDFNENVGVDAGNFITGQNPDDNGDWKFRKDARATLQQLIFDGFFTDSEVERQQARLKSAGNRVQDQGQVSALDAVNAYLDVLRHRERVKNAEKNVAVHEQTLALVEKRAQLGGGNVADVHQTEARLATAKTNLISIQGNLRDSEATFRRIIGEAPSDLDPAMIKDGLMGKSVDESLTKGLASNPKVLLAKADVEVSDAEIKQQEASLYPDLRLEVAGGITENDGGTESTDHSASALLVMRYNLYRGGADMARIREFKERRSESMENLRAQERAVEEQVRLSWSQRQTQYESVANLEKQVDANKKTREIYAQQFDIGQRGLLDLLDISNDLFLSEDDLITARYFSTFTDYKILAAEGSLVQALGIAFPKEATPGELTN